MELATGLFPFTHHQRIIPRSPGDTELGGEAEIAIVELLEAITNEPVPELDPNHFSGEIRDFVRACLNRDPERRPTPSILMVTTHILSSNIHACRRLTLSSSISTLICPFGPRASCIVNRIHYNLFVFTNLLGLGLLTGIGGTVREGLLGGHELANLVTHHLLSNHQRDILLSIVHQKMGSYKGWDYGVPTGMCLDSGSTGIRLDGIQQ